MSYFQSIYADEQLPHRSTVKRALKELERTGWIRRQPRYRENGSSTSNLYTLLR